MANVTNPPNLMAQMIEATILKSRVLFQEDLYSRKVIVRYDLSSTYFFPPFKYVEEFEADDWLQDDVKKREFATRAQEKCFEFLREKLNPKTEKGGT